MSVKFERDGATPAREYEAKMMSLSHAAQVLGIGRTTAWNLYKTDEFPVPVVKIGSRLHVVRAHLDEFIETGVPVRRESQASQAAQ